MKRVRTQAEKDRNALRKRMTRQEDSVVHIDVSVVLRDQLNGVREVLNYPDQRTVIADGIALLSNFKSYKAQFMETKDNRRVLFVSEKEQLISLLEGAPCRECCAPIAVSSTSNVGTSLSVTYVCKNGHEKIWKSSIQNKERTHCAADFDLCAASIMAKSTAAKLRDTLEAAGFKPMSTTVFNKAQNQLSEIAAKSMVFDKALTESKIRLANGDAAPEWEIDTAYHTRINSWTSTPTCMDARTKLIGYSGLEVTGASVCSQQLEKIGVGKALPAVIEQYGGASSVTSDSCGSLLNQVADIIKPLVDKGECEQLRDIWHQQKGVYSKFVVFVDAKWGTLPVRYTEASEKHPAGQRISNSMSDIKENAARKQEAKKLARWMRGHFTYVIDRCGQDVGVAKEIW